MQTDITRNSWRQLDWTKAEWRRGRTRDCRETTSPSGQCYTWTCDLWITESVPQPLVNTASWWDFVSVSGCLCVQIVVRLSASRSQTTTLTNFVAQKAVIFRCFEALPETTTNTFCRSFKNSNAQSMESVLFSFSKCYLWSWYFYPEQWRHKDEGFWITEKNLFFTTFGDFAIMIPLNLT